MAKSNAKGSTVNSSGIKTARVLGALLLFSCLSVGFSIQAAYAEDEIKEAGVEGTNVTRAGFSNASAWGNSTVAEGSNSTAWGSSTLAKGKNATAWGIDSKAEGNNSTAFGSHSSAIGMNSLAALGGISNGVSSVAIGMDAMASAMHSIAFGMEAKADLTHSVAIGSYSVANRAAGVTGFSPDGSTVKGSAWVATQSAIAVGASANDSDTATVTRQITGVAAGTFDTDVVNVAQLKSAMQNAGKTYTAGDGIAIDNASNVISVKSSPIASDADGFAKAATVYMEVRPSKDGNYVKKTLSTATNLAILDTQLKQTTDALNTETAERKTAVSGEAADRKAADDALSKRMGSLTANGKYIKKDKDFSANLAELDANLYSGLNREVTERNAAITNATNALKAADTALGTRIDTEVSDRTAADTALGTRINTEVSDRTAADTALGQRIDKEASERATFDNTLSQLVNIEHSERIAGDTALSDRIGSLSSNGSYIIKSDSVFKNLSALDVQLARTSAGLETEIVDRGRAVSNEASTRAAADTALSNRIGSLSKNGNYIKQDYDVALNLSVLDAQMKAADTAVNALTDSNIANIEIMAEYADVVENNRQSILANTNDIIKLNNKTTAIETNLKEEEYVRAAADKKLDTRIDNEITARGAADQALDSRIDKEASDRSAADAALGARIDNEITARGTTEKALDSRISQEASARVTADTALGYRIDKEASARVTADTALGYRIDKEAADRAAADTALSNRIGAIAEDGSIIQKDINISDNLILLDQALQEQNGITEDMLEKKAEADASNVGKNAKSGDNSTAWGSALGTGEVESKNGKLITGSTVYNEVRTESDGTYVKTYNTTAANLTALDTQLKANTDAIAQNEDEIEKNSADITENRDNIAANTADIATNAKGIAENRKNIAANAADIASNTKNITKVKTTADNALSGVEMLLVGTDLNLEDIIATDDKVEALAAQNGVIGTAGTEHADEFVKGSAVYDYLNKGELVLGIESKSISIGKGSEAIEENSIAIGTGIKVHGKRSGAIGDPGDVFGDESYVIGNNPKVNGNGTFVVGNDANVTGDNNFVLGHKAKVTGKNNIVLGNEVTIDNVDDAIVLGNNSKAETNAVSVGSDTKQRQIKHVARGEDDTDAATVGQVREVKQAAYNNAVNLSNSINNLDSRINKVGAGAAALAALHPIDTDDKFSMGLGYGNYHSANAMAMGMFYRPTEKIMISVGGAVGNGENMINAGISFALDKGKNFGTSKALMARKIAAQDDIIAAQGAELEAQKAEIQSLKEALARLEAKIGK